MTLLQLTRAIEDLAKNEPTVSSIVRNDILRLNAAPAVKYGAFAWTQGTHSVAGDMVSFQLYLYFVDRLMPSKENEVQAESVAISTLVHILKGLEDVEDVDVGESSRIVPFSYRFADECAGAYTEVTVTVPVDYACNTAVPGLDGFENLDNDENILIRKP